MAYSDVWKFVDLIREVGHFAGAWLCEIKISFDLGNMQCARCCFWHYYFVVCVVLENRKSYLFFNELIEMKILEQKKRNFIVKELKKIYIRLSMYDYTIYYCESKSENIAKRSAEKNCLSKRRKKCRKISKLLINVSSAFLLEIQNILE